MTRKLSLITAVGIAALSVGAPAAFGKVHANAEVAPVLAQPNPLIEDGFAQAVAQVSTNGFRDAHESGSVTQSAVSSHMDAFERAEPYRGTVAVSATTSGIELEWPQIGVGLGIGLLLALGLGLIVRTAHIRPFAH